MLIHLKRWTFDPRTLEDTKIDDAVEYPAQYRVSADITYKLKSFIVHRGRVNAGHYVAFVLDEQRGWLYYDDAHPPVSIETSYALKQKPYMLFYERRG